MRKNLRASGLETPSIFTTRLVDSLEQQKSLEKFFAMPPTEYSLLEITKLTLVWIEDRDYLWDLPLDDLCLYARLDMFGDSDEKEWVNGLIKKAVYKIK